MVDGVPSEKVSTLSFVDLAGTDRRYAKVSYLSCVELCRYSILTLFTAVLINFSMNSSMQMLRLKL